MTPRDREVLRSAVAALTEAAPRLNLEQTEELRGPLTALMQAASRINEEKPQRYWYPLSIATYDVEEVLAAVDSMCSFRTTMWEKTAEFERRFSEVIGMPESIMVNSGSSADLLIALALTNERAGILRRGDEVLVPSVTWPTQLWSLAMTGLRVKLVDTDPQTLNMDLADLERKISDNTRAISLVHLMGNPCDMDAIMKLSEKHDLVVIEDCCEALGARFDEREVGTFGLASSFSFFFSHHITTMEGGMVCSRGELSDLLRTLRAHGWQRNLSDPIAAPAPGTDPRYLFVNWGLNVRPTEVQAAFGLVQLSRLPLFNETRVRNAASFSERLARLGGSLELMKVDPRAECSWFALPLMVPSEAPFSRDELATFLEARGIETRPIVAGSLVRHPVAELFPELKDEGLPGASEVHERGLYLGLYPVEMTRTFDRFFEVLEEFLEPHKG